MQQRKRIHYKSRIIMFINENLRENTSLILPGMQNLHAVSSSQAMIELHYHLPLLWPAKYTKRKKKNSDNYRIKHVQNWSICTEPNSKGHHIVF